MNSYKSVTIKLQLIDIQNIKYKNNWAVDFNKKSFPGGESFFIPDPVDERSENTGLIYLI